MAGSGCGIKGMVIGGTVLMVLAVVGAGANCAGLLAIGGVRGPGLT